MKRKGFTLVELLVVIAIIALLMSILLPALAKIRARAYRMLCGTNLSGIGKAIMVYATDYDEQYPRAGGVANSTWTAGNTIASWDAATAGIAYGPFGRVTVTSSLYLLIKYSDVTPKQFVCNGDGARTFELSHFNTPLQDITDAWDFGPGGGINTKPGGYCSYAYHLPYSAGSTGSLNFPLSPTSNPASPLCADRNPYFDSKAASYIDGAAVPPDIAPVWNNTRRDIDDPDKTMNAAAHDRDGQNVLFNDSHVSWERKPNVGVNNDNIYKSWPNTTPTLVERQRGTLRTTLWPNNGVYGPRAEADAYLVGEKN